MAGKAKSLVGLRFHRFVVLARDAAPHNKPQWICRCDCGNIKSVRSDALKSGSTVSCGCFSKEQTKRNLDCTVHGHAKSSGKSRTWYCWQNMKRRCYDPRSVGYAFYGARGITVCQRWRQSFTSFLADMGECPDKLTIERIDNNKGYSPSNCRWATQKEQSNNRRLNKDARLITMDGKTQHLAAWCREVNLSYNLVCARLHKGWDEIKALTVPKDVRKTGRSGKFARIKTANV